MESKDNDDIDSLREEHRKRVFDLYQHKANNVQIMLGIIIGFTVIFFFIIFLPYTSDLKIINELAQNISNTSDLINQSENEVRRYNAVYDGIKQVNTELNEAPIKLENFVNNISEPNYFDPLQYDNSSYYLTKFSEPTNIKLITNENNTYVIFVEGNSLRFIAFDRNNNLTQSYAIHNSSQGIRNTDIAMHNSDVFVVWYENNSFNPEGKIFFKRSNDNGDTFKPTVTVTLANVTSSLSDLKFISSANTIYIIGSVYPKDNSLGRQIFFTKSTDDGASFEPIKIIGNNLISYDIAISNNNIYVVGNSKNIQKNSIYVYFTKSTDNGNTFKPISIIYNDTEFNTNQHDNRFSLSNIVVNAQDNNVYIGWTKTNQNKTGSLISSIYFKKSNNNGTSFDSLKRIENVSGRISNLEMKSSKNNLFIKWDAAINDATGKIKLRSPIPLHFDLSIKRSFDHGQNFFDKKSIVKSNSFPLRSKLFVQQQDLYITILSIHGNDLLMSKSYVFGDIPFNTIRFSNATDIEFVNSLGNGLNSIGLNSEEDVYAISANKDIRLNIFSPSYSLKKTTHDLGPPICPKVGDESRSTLPEVFQCNVKTFANSLLETIEPKIQKNIIIPLEYINDNNSKLANLSSDIRSDLKGFIQLFDRILSKEYPLFNTMDGRLELKDMLTQQSDQFWKQYKSKIDNETQQLVSKIDSLNNETKLLSNKKIELIKHQNEIVDRLHHIRLPIGEIPLGFNESIAAYPLIISGGLLILALMLVETMNVRKAFHLLSLKKDPRRKLFTNQQIALSLPLWIDPLSSRMVQVIKFLVLLIPFIFFILSCYTIFTLNVQSTFPIFTENVMVNNLIYIGVYLISSTFFAFSYYQLIKGIHDYQYEINSKK